MRVKRVIIGIIALPILLYAVEDLKLRLCRNAFGSVVIKPSYAVKQKDGRVEYYFLDPQTVQCVHAVAPHMGASPCWYLSRQADKQTKF